MTDTFSEFSVAVSMPKQQAKIVDKALVDKLFYDYGIPSRIHSDQGKRFGTNIIKQICKIYGVKQSIMTQYDTHCNSLCKYFNHMSLNLVKTLHEDQRFSWPAHCGALVFVHNVTSHSRTGY